ncbi:MAG: hydroxyacylglutathione hydrolase [Thermoproteota archaeon]|nr:hydroxyacylglutathione hydrolase [Thermoproteota archaeon]
MNIANCSSLVIYILKFQYYETGRKMRFERVKSEGLEHISYFASSEGQAAVIDPRRDCEVYLDLAKKEESKIKFIFETHRNEDYVIGSLELAKLTGASIFHGSGLDFKYGEGAADGQNFSFGALRLTALQTPGHTPESMSYALSNIDDGEKPFLVFTGDTLFVGEVGRTDLSGPEKAELMSGKLYDSIFKKLLPLGEGVIICPAHSGGSICGRAISDREQSTIGLEQLNNPALQKDKKDFVQTKISELLETPPYFKTMERYNLEGPPFLSKSKTISPLSTREFEMKMKSGALVLDTRSPLAFGGAHVKGSYSIWLKGIPSFTGWFLPYDKSILLILEEKEHLDQAFRYLVRLGYDQVEGYLGGGLSRWYGRALPLEHLGLLTVQQFKGRLSEGGRMVVLDVRTEEEWEEGHIEGAIHIYVGHLPEHIKEFSKDEPIAVICSIGNRSSIGASILRREGYFEVYNVLGGMTAWKNAGYLTIR